VPIERIRYFARQLLDEADFTQEQEYLRDKARRHNRMLHGWGVVSGLCVESGEAKGVLKVGPGYALDSYGNEIVVDDEVTVDLCSEDGDDSVVSPDRPFYVAIRYSKCLTRPVPGGESLEYSRVREGFAVTVLTELPASPPSREPDSHPCPDLPTQPWVVLAEVVLDSNLNISNVDCGSHRRQVGTDSARTTIVGECESKT
jgi:hypothetical protein